MKSPTKCPGIPMCESVDVRFCILYTLGLFSEGPPCYYTSTKSFGCSPFFLETDYTNLLPVNLPVQTLCFIKALKVCSHLLFVFVGSINLPKTNCLEVSQSGKSKQLKTADLRASTHKKKRFDILTATHKIMHPATSWILQRSRILATYINHQKQVWRDLKFDTLVKSGVNHVIDIDIKHISGKSQKISKILSTWKSHDFSAQLFTLNHHFKNRLLQLESLNQTSTWRWNANVSSFPSILQTGLAFGFHLGFLLHPVIQQSQPLHQLNALPEWSCFALPAPDKAALVGVSTGTLFLGEFQHSLQPTQKKATPPRN